MHARGEGGGIIRFRIGVNTGKKKTDVPKIGGGGGEEAALGRVRCTTGGRFKLEKLLPLAAPGVV